MLNEYLGYIQESVYKLITFPKTEHAAIKQRFQTRNPVYTVRVDKEYDQYKAGEILETEWGSLVKVVSVEKIKDIKKYKYFNELTFKQVKFLKKYNKLDIVELTYVRG